MNDDAGETPTTAEGEQPGQEAARQPPRPFLERLYVAWWAWPLPLLAAGMLAASVQRGYPGLPMWLPYAILMPVAGYVLVAMSRTTVRVDTADGAELRVGQAHVPLRFVGAVQVIDSDGKRKAFGPHLDPAAFVVHRAWIGTALRVELTDPDDATPYWLFSTRKPEQLAAALGTR